MDTITRDELQRLLAEDGVVLLEALPAMHYDAEHLPGALNLPLDDVERLAPELVPDRSATVVTYCTGTTCPNSALAAARLRALGYTDVRAYEGGKEEWVGAGLPVESTPSPVA